MKMEEITAEELYYKSIEQQVTHRQSWEQIGKARQFQYEAFAEWANQLFREKQVKQAYNKITEVI